MLDQLEMSLTVHHRGQHQHYGILYCQHYGILYWSLVVVANKQMKWMRSKKMMEEACTLLRETAA